MCARRRRRSHRRSGGVDPIAASISTGTHCGGTISHCGRPGIQSKNGSSYIIYKYSVDLSACQEAAPPAGAGRVFGQARWAGTKLCRASTRIPVNLARSGHVPAMRRGRSHGRAARSFAATRACDGRSGGGRFGSQPAVRASTAAGDAEPRSDPGDPARNGRAAEMEPELEPEPEPTTSKSHKKSHNLTILVKR